MPFVPDILVLSDPETIHSRNEKKLKGCSYRYIPFSELKFRSDRFQENVFIVNPGLLSKYLKWCTSLGQSEERINSTIILSDKKLGATKKAALYNHGFFFVADCLTSERLFRKKLNWLIAQKLRFISHHAFASRLNAEFFNHHSHVKGQNELLHMAVHDLRSPLSAMLCYAELLMDGVLDDLTAKGIDPINVIHQNCQFLIDMVNDLLDVAQMEAGKKKLKLLRSNLVTIINKVSRTLAGLAKSKNISIELNLLKVPDIFCDTHKMERVVMNLLANAIKFTKHKGVIRIQCSKKGNFIILAIQDSGPGISKKDINNIFDKFNIGDDSAISGKGHGLGLAITRSFVEMHGGKIFVESERHKGSTFIIHLPIEKRLESTKHAKEVGVAILDYAGDGKGLRDVNKISGAAVEFFDSEDKLIKKMEGCNYACLVVNENNEYGNVSRAIFPEVLQGRFRFTPTVILVPNRLGNDEVELFSHLNIFFIQKPISVQILETKIQQALNKERRKSFSIRL